MIDLVRGMVVNVVNQIELLYQKRYMDNVFMKESPRLIMHPIGFGANAFRIV